jgi:hypothetical protein
MRAGGQGTADGFLPEEDQEEYGRLAEALRESLRPEGVRECTLAARITEGAWRLQRAGRYEQYALRAAGDGRAAPKERPSRTQTCDRISRYEAHLERCLRRAIAALRRLQKEHGG